MRLAVSGSRTPSEAMDGSGGIIGILCRKRITDQDTDVMRRLLQGGSTASLAAAAVGLPARGLWYWWHPSPMRRTCAAWYIRGDWACSLPIPVRRAVLRRVPGTVPIGPSVVAVAGPGGPEEVGVFRRRASSAARAATARGLTGLHEVADLATLTALQDRADLAAALGDRHATAIDGLGRTDEATVPTTRAWLECAATRRRPRSGSSCTPTPCATVWRP